MKYLVLLVVLLLHSLETPAQSSTCVSLDPSAKPINEEINDAIANSDDCLELDPGMYSFQSEFTLDVAFTIKSTSSAEPATIRFIANSRIKVEESGDLHVQDVIFDRTFGSEAFVEVTSPSASATLEGCTLSGGRVYSQGTLTMTDTDISHGFVSVNSIGGGCIEVAGASATLTNVNMRSCVAAGGDGGAMAAVSAVVTLIDCTIENNYATGIGGGLLIGSGATVTVASSTDVSFNTAGGSGGGVYVASTGTLILDASSVVRSNYALGSGGGVCGAGASLSVAGTIEDNTAGQDGGGLAGLSFSLVTFESSALITNNTAATGSGGGLAWITVPDEGVLALPPGVVVSSNTAAVSGGGLYVASLGVFAFLADVDLKMGSVLQANIAGQSGGGLYAVGLVTVSAAGSVLNNTVGYDGGGLAVNGSSVSLYVTGLVEHNVALYNGGGVSAVDGAGFTLSSGAEVLSNSAGGSGGGLYVSEVALTFEGGTRVDFNVALSGAGGGIYASLNTVLVCSADATVSLSFNMAYVGSGSSPDRGFGGGLYLKGTEVSPWPLEGGLTVEGNWAEEKGGGVFLGIAGKVTVKDGCQLKYNTAGVNGGAFSATAASVMLELVGGYLEYNYAGENGGAIFFSPPATLIMTGGTISRNTAGGLGGGLSLDGLSTTHLSGSTTVSANVAGGGGGGLALSDAAVVHLEGAALVDFNVALNSSGGGVLVLDSNARLVVDGPNVRVRSNHAGESGGGVFLDSGTSLKIDNGAELTENSAALNGGGLFAMAASSVVVTGGGTVAVNSAAGHGGGLYLDNASVELKSGGAVASNIAQGGHGGGLYLTGYAANAVVTLEAGFEAALNEAVNGAGGGLFLACPLHLNVSGMVRQNTAELGGGIYGSNGVVVSVSGLSGALFANRATINGGGLYLSGPASVATVSSGGIIDSNSAANNGSGVHLSDHSFLLVEMGGQVVGNIAEDGVGGALYGSNGARLMVSGATAAVSFNGAVSGGALYMDGPSSSITVADGAVLAFNLANADGGAVHLTNSASLLVWGGSLTSNAASGSGGAIYGLDGANVTLCGATVVVTHNTASIDGGGLWTGGPLSSLTVSEGARISNNVAFGNGGGVAVTSGNLLVTNTSSLSFNAAANMGGAAWIDGADSIAVLSGRVVNNTAAHGGGLALSAQGTVVLNDGATVSSNTAEDSGGGLYLEDTAVTVGDGVLVEYNRVTNLHMEGRARRRGGGGVEGGGGVSVYIGASLTVSGSGMVRSNVCPLSLGGGVLAFGESASVEVGDGAMIVNNEGASGGGVAVQEGALLSVLAGGSVESNVAAASGGGIYATDYPSRVLLSGTLKLNHAAGPYGKGGGGLCLDSSANATLYSGALIAWNTASSGNGGGVLVKGLSSLSIGESVIVDITNNTASRGGGLSFDTCVVRWTRTAVPLLISRNVAFELGGGLYIASGADVELTGPVVVSSNSAAERGGGVAVESGTSLAVAVLAMGNGTRVSGNSAATSGGGLFVGAHSSLSVARDALIVANTVVGGTESSSNPVQGGGLALDGPGASAVIVGKVTGNVVARQVVDVDGSGASSVGTASVRLRSAAGLDTEGDDDSCNGLGRGGGIHVGSGGGNVWLEGSLEGNVGDSGGGAYLEGPNSVLHLGGGDGSGSGSSGGGGGGGLIVDNTAASQCGGGVYAASGAQLVVSGHGQVVGNNASRSGGGVFARGLNTSVEVFSADGVRANTASEFGGGLSMTSFSLLTVHANSSVSWNVCTKSGGGVFVTSNAAAHVYGTLDSNTARDTEGSRGGGALYASLPAFVTLGPGSRLLSNRAIGGEGGGLAAFLGEEWVGPPITVSGCLFENNAATKVGGALALSNYVAHLADSVFLNNSAAQDGGALFVASIPISAPRSETGRSLVILDASIFVEWVQLRNNSCGGAGGAVYMRDVAEASWYNVVLQGGLPNRLGGCLAVVGEESFSTTASEFVNVEFDGCTASDHGGAVFWSGLARASFVGSVFKGCVAGGNGGALAVTGTQIPLDTLAVSLINVTLTDCSAVQGGSLFWTSANRALVFGSLFEGSSASTLGGAISVENGLLDVQRCTLRRNAAVSGGALHMMNDGAVTFVDSLCTENSDGLVVMFSTGSLIVNDSVLAYNRGPAVDVLIVGSLEVVSSVIAHNEAPLSAAMYVFLVPTFTFANCFVYNNTGDGLLCAVTEVTAPQGSLASSMCNNTGENLRCNACTMVFNGVDLCKDVVEDVRPFNRSCAAQCLSAPTASESAFSSTYGSPFFSFNPLPNSSSSSFCVNDGAAFVGPYAGGCESCGGLCQTLQPCSPYAYCIDDPSSMPDGYECECGIGFVAVGSGTGAALLCADVNECNTTLALTCPFDSMCTNTPGSFFCDCGVGLRAVGGECFDVDECGDGSSSCSDDPAGACSNTLGSFLCTCSASYYGDGTNCTACPGNSTVPPGSIFSASDCVCLSGHYRSASWNESEAQGASEPCLTCGAGSRVDEGTDLCTTCSAGTYSSGVNVGSCMSCPLNSWSVSGAKSVEECTCSEGYFLNVLNECQLACPPGTFVAEGNQASGGGEFVCVPCPPSTFSTAVNASECTACPPRATTGGISGGDSPSLCTCPAGLVPIDPLTSDGLVGPSGCEVYCPPGTREFNDDCIPCPRGFYSNTSNVAACTRCPPHSSTLTESSASVAACVCDEFFSGRVDGVGACELSCQPGWFAATDTDCAVCPQNYFSVNVSQKVCMPCPDNRVTGGDGAKSPQDCTCLAGFVPVDPTQAVTSPCERYCGPGSYRTGTGDQNGGGACVLCPLNTYSAAPNEPSCTPCPFNTVTLHINSSQATDCVCGAGFTLPPGAAPGSACELVCPAGSYLPSVEINECVLCPSDTYGPTVGATACVACPPFSTTNGAPGAVTLEACACSEGYYRVELGDGGDGGDGGSAFACESCPEGAFCEGGTEPPTAKPGYGPVGEGFEECRPAVACAGNGECSPGYTGELCAYCEVKHFRLDGRCEPCRSKPGLVIFLLYMVFFAFCAFLVLFNLQDRVVNRFASLMISVNSLQIMGLYGRLDLEWPALAKEFFSVLSFANLNIELVSPECAVASSSPFVLRWVLTLVLPLFTLLNMGVVYLLLLLWMAKGVSSRAGAFAARLLGESLNELTPRRAISVVQRAFAQLLVIAYLPLASTVLEFFACTQTAPERWIVASSPDMTCYDRRYWGLLPVALAGTLLYVVGIPAAYAAVLWFKRRQVGEAVFALDYGFLVGRYRPQLYFYELAILARKLLVVVMMTVVGGQASNRALATVLVLIVALLLNQYFQPYHTALYNAMEALCLMSAMIILVLTLMFDGVANDDGSKNTVIVLVILMNLLVLAMGVASDVRRLRAEEIAVDNELELADRTIVDELVETKGLVAVVDLGTTATQERRRLQAAASDEDGDPLSTWDGVGGGAATNAAQETHAKEPLKGGPPALNDVGDLASLRGSISSGGGGSGATAPGARAGGSEVTTQSGGRGSGGGLDLERPNERWTVENDLQSMAGLRVSPLISDADLK